MNLSTLRLSNVLGQFSKRLSSSMVINTKEPIAQSHLKRTDPGEDAPVELKENPYLKPEDKCILCKHGIKLDYKNARLLQQFVSSFSGRVYEQHITGLCARQHKTLLRTIKFSRKAGYMPVVTKDPKYLRDPKLFDPLHPIKPHSFD